MPTIWDEHALYVTLWRLGKEKWMKHYGDLQLKGGGKETQLKSYKIKRYDDPEMTRIIFESPRDHCLQVVVEKREKIAILSALHYDPDCTSPVKMEKGQDTRDMLEYAFTLMKEAGANEVYLTDNSYIMCGKKKVSLSRMSFLKYGMTWYENYFGFQPEREDHRECYEEMKRLRLQVAEVDDLVNKPCEYFDEETMKQWFKRMGDTNQYFETFGWVKKL